MNRIIMNNVYKGRKVSEIARVGLEGKEDTVLLFRELINSYPKDLWKNAGEDELCDLIRVVDSDTDEFIKGDARKNYSRAFLKQHDREEEEVLEFYKDRIRYLFETLSKVDF